jgi:transposase InsO family protein
VLEALITAFPFRILGFHTDNGSEYINRQVAGLLNKLQVSEFTKSRARHTNDNALVESKNGSVVRKHLGYAHIPGRFAAPVNHFTQNVLSPYLNFHRPCCFPTEAVDARGRLRKRYRYENMMTPYEKLKSLPDANHYLKPGVTFEQLDAHASAMSDNDAARHLNQARARLFRSINKTQTPAA